MEYPKTDDDWVKLAECIVTNYSKVTPEHVGALTANATATIFSWYKGEERHKALTERQYARDDLLQLGRDAGCIPITEREVAGVSFRWLVKNNATGEKYEMDKVYPTPDEAMSMGKLWADVYLYNEYLNGAPVDPRGFMVTVIDKDRQEVSGYEEWHKPKWLPELLSGKTVISVYDYPGQGARERAEETLERISQPLDISQQRPFPKTYGDWVDLAESIKEKYPDDPVMRASVNFQLQRIAQETEEPVEEKEERLKEAEEAKRWFVTTAGELGIT